MSRIAIVDNEKLRNMQEKLHIQSICPVNRTGNECIKIDDAQNQLNRNVISVLTSPVCIRVMHTNKQIIIPPISKTAS